jgi:hypothetical protein
MLRQGVGAQIIKTNKFLNTMAEQSSIIKLRGNIDGITFYKRDGKDFARKSGGINKAKLQSHPDYEQMRRRLKEFAAVAGAGKAFNEAFEQVKELKKGKFHQQLLKVLRYVIDGAPGDYGTRGIPLSLNRDRFVNLELNPEVKLASLYKRSVDVVRNAQRNIVDFEMNFTPAEILNAPANATHFKIVQFATIVSDTEFNTESNEHELAETALHATFRINRSEYGDVKSTVPFSVISNLVLPPVNDKVSVFQCVGIIFYEYIGNVYFPMKDAKAMKIVDVF